MPRRTLITPNNTPVTGVLYMAFDLGSTKWELAFGVSTQRRHRRCRIEARKLTKILKEIQLAKKSFGLPEDAPVLSCYEAGRDGFYIHRWLLKQSIKNFIVDSASIEVNRRLRRVKTDRIDAGKLLNMLYRYNRGEKALWSVVQVPDRESEDFRHLSRELESLKRECTKIYNSIQSMLALYGISLAQRKMKSLEHFPRFGPDGEEIRAHLWKRLERDWQRILLLRKQIRELEGEQKQLELDSDTPAIKKIHKLKRLRSIGDVISWCVVSELFGWRVFPNGRHLGAASGFAPTPYKSDQSEREQGIGKSGNKRVRALMVEIAWLWLRHQPQSRLSLWFEERFGRGGKRMRRIGIVALARKLLIALWRYVEYDEVPEGATFKPSERTGSGRMTTGCVNGQSA